MFGRTDDCTRCIWKSAMKTRALIKSAISTVALMTSAAEAQNAAVLDKLKAWDAAAPPPERSILVAELERIEKDENASSKLCPATPIAIESVHPITSSRLVFSAILQGQLRNGWVIHTRRPGCSEKDLFRYALFQKPDGSFVGGFVNLGPSHANPTLMRDTSPVAALQAYVAVRKIKPDCDGKDMAMERTRIGKEGKDLGPDVFGVRYTGGWSEIWTFSTCAKRVDVTVEFTADGDGGAYTKSPAGSVKLLDESK